MLGKRPGWLLASLLMFSFSATAVDRTQDSWYLQTSVYTQHYSPEPDHNNHQRLIGIERHLPDASLWGAATFKHSFGERANYLYYGKRFALGESAFYLKLTGGLLEGYKGEYQDKIPLNRLGVAPAIVPSVGASHNRLSAELVLLGAAAAMVTVGVRL
tara:strand:- start:185773 stop:186246 length:474 start_codon:yes stop_codon:yes gene_type:complete